MSSSNALSIGLSKVTPRIQQRNALTAIAKALEDHNRATAVMACGSGKTLVGLWAAADQQPNSVIVLVPSLALLRQTYLEWHEHAPFAMAALCVCSDKDIAAGENGERGDDLSVADIEATGLKATTDHYRVRQFLKLAAHHPAIAPEGEGTSGADQPVKVIFSTYQSSEVVGEAMEGLPAFDVGIFDEAHKTASGAAAGGASAGAFSFALDDANLAIRKRLFFTATPRVHKTSKDKDGDFQVISMDNQAVYGPVAYTLSFAQAVREKIIVPYKIVISVVDSATVTREQMLSGGVDVNGQILPAEDVAKKIALRQAIEKHDIKRVITFHSRVDDAAAFVGRLPMDAGEHEENSFAASVAPHLPGFDLFHVSGLIPAAQRDESMRQFGQAERGLITNARCLTEGVDVPSVDMVAFMDTRKSTIDIAQAAGRAMRTSPGKNTGYIFVPLFIEPQNGESVAEAAHRTGYKQVIEILSAMRDIDEALVDEVREAGESKGRGDDLFDCAEFLSGQVEVIGPSIDIVDLNRSIRAQILDGIGASWFERLGELKAFTAEHGHCNVPLNTKLGHWVSNQRQLFKQGRMPQERIDLLESIGFQWEAWDIKWNTRFEELKLFKAEHGHCNAPTNTKLGQWVSAQRQLFKRGRMSQERIDLLESIAFLWEVLDSQWNTQFEELKLFKAEHGHCNVPINAKLGKWVSDQRQLFKRGRMSQERIDLLESIAFLWEVLDSQWNTRFEELKLFKAEHGHCNAPRNAKLGKWVSAQRQLFKRGRMSQERIDLLESIGFQWEVFDIKWNTQFEELKLFKAEHGHCNAPKNAKLGKWVSNQRNLFKQGRMPQERIDLLESIGFQWEVLAIQWNTQFEELKLFKAEHGHCNVPINTKLGHWVSNQRNLFKQGRMSQERIDLLESIAFLWEVLDSQWNTQFEELKLFKAEHGHCNAPRNAKLGKWVSDQRQLFKRGRMSQERIDLLESIGFLWEVLDIKWNTQFEELKLFTAEHGHCNVPINTKLGHWVSNQRQLFKRGRMSQERIDLLESIGFQWEVLAIQWNTQFEELKLFTAEHGHCNAPTNTKLGQWVSAQRQLFKRGRMSQERIDLLNSLGLDWTPAQTVAWLATIKPLLSFSTITGHCNIPGDDSLLLELADQQRKLYASGQMPILWQRHLESMGFDLEGDADVQYARQSQRG